jgi:hypothetical protein
MALHALASAPRGVSHARRCTLILGAFLLPLLALLAWPHVVSRLSSADAGDDVATPARHVQAADLESVVRDIRERHANGAHDTDFLDTWARWPNETCSTADRILQQPGIVAKRANVDCHGVTAELNRTWYRRRYVTAEAVKPGYGLTNQLLVYAGLHAYAMIDTVAPITHGSRFETGSPRHILFPPARFHANRLINWSASTCRGCRDVVVTDPCEAAFIRDHSKRARNLRIALSKAAISRSLVSNHPMEAYKSYANIMAEDTERRVVILWDMYRRWPFASRPKEASFGAFACGLRFVAPLESIAAAAAATLRARAAQGYLSVHLRMEPQDMATMGRALSSHAQTARFFADNIVPLARQHNVSAVVLHSGPLLSDLTASIRQTLARASIRLFTKIDLLRGAGAVRWPAEPDSLPLLHEHTIVRPTSASRAAVDVLLMDAAKVSVLTAFSSITALVASRRCCSAFETDRAGDGGSSPSGNVFIYDVALDGTLTKLQPYRCGVSIPPYLEALDLETPTGREDVFRPNFDPASPLLT